MFLSYIFRPGITHLKRYIVRPEEYPVALPMPAPVQIIFAESRVFMKLYVNPALTLLHLVGHLIHAAIIAVYI
jgi:hypothetical protein